jgi:hypothetical protein
VSSTSAAPSSSAPSGGSGAASNIGDVCAYDPVQAQKALAQGKPPTSRG